jgi:hypothetical protein
MSLTPKKNQSYEPVPTGNHVARLYEIIHIGTIPTTWQGQEKMTDKIRLGFELCNETKEFKEGEGEKPFSLPRVHLLIRSERKPSSLYRRHDRH